jgi:hypothetical protein
MPWADLLQAVEESIAKEDREVLERVMEALQALHAKPPRMVWGRDEQREVPVQDVHVFNIWLWGLVEGSWNLPRQMPRECLQAFVCEYGAVLYRCERCLMGYSNGARRLWAECPVCGSREISWKDLSGNDVDGWDSHWEYTPLMCNGMVSYTSGNKA